MDLKQLHQQKDAITRRSEFALLSLQFYWLPWKHDRPGLKADSVDVRLIV